MEGLTQNRDRNLATLQTDGIATLVHTRRIDPLTARSLGDVRVLRVVRAAQAPLHAPPIDRQNRRLVEPTLVDPVLDEAARPENGPENLGPHRHSIACDQLNREPLRSRILDAPEHGSVRFDRERYRQPVADLHPCALFVARVDRQNACAHSSASCALSTRSCIGRPTTFCRDRLTHPCSQCVRWKQSPIGVDSHSPRDPSPSCSPTRTGVGLSQPAHSVIGSVMLASTPTRYPCHVAPSKLPRARSTSRAADHDRRTALSPMYSAQRS